MKLHGCYNSFPKHYLYKWNKQDYIPWHSPFRYNHSLKPCHTLSQFLPFMSVPLPSSFFTYQRVTWKFAEPPILQHSRAHDGIKYNFWAKCGKQHVATACGAKFTAFVKVGSPKEPTIGNLKLMQRNYPNLNFCFIFLVTNPLGKNMKSIQSQWSNQCIRRKYQFFNKKGTFSVDSASVKTFISDFEKFTKINLFATI